MVRRKMKRTPNPAEIVASTPVENKQVNNNLEQLNNRWNDVFRQFSNSNDYMAGLVSWYTNNPWVQNQRLKNLKSPPMFM